MCSPSRFLALVVALSTLGQPAASALAHGGCGRAPADSHASHEAADHGHAASHSHAGESAADPSPTIAGCECGCDCGPLHACSGSAAALCTPFVTAVAPEHPGVIDTRSPPRSDPICAPPYRPPIGRSLA